MPRSKTSKRWLHEHFNDFYVKKAHAAGYRSRAIYKLKDIDEKEHLLQPGIRVIDLGAAPGGWTQYIVEKLKGKGTIIALDKLTMDSFPDVHFILGDFQEDVVLQNLMDALNGKPVDLIVSDMAPNLSGNEAIDIPKAMYLAELTVHFAEQTLKKGGILLMKMFQGTGFDELNKLVKLQFQKVKICKPAASRSRSREVYLLAKGFKLV